MSVHILECFGFFLFSLFFASITNVLFVLLYYQVGLKQGLEMLRIFKSYSEKTSLLDDFMFYEDREKSFRAKRSPKPALQNDVFKKDDISVSLHLRIYIQF